MRARLLAALLCTLGAAEASLAACGATTCTCVTGSTEGLLAAGAVQVDLSYGWFSQSRKRAGAEEAEVVITPHVDFESRRIEPRAHREIATEAMELKLELAMGITRRITLTSTPR